MLVNSQVVQARLKWASVYSTDVTQQSKYKDLYEENGSILKPKKYERRVFAQRKKQWD